jgi:hypothetical protein
MATIEKISIPQPCDCGHTLGDFCSDCWSQGGYWSQDVEKCPDGTYKAVYPSFYDEE